MASGLGLDILQDSGKFPCAVCRTGVGRSSIQCSKCNLWVHYKKCSGLKTLGEDMSYECPRCHGELGVRPIDGRPYKEVEVGDCVLEAVDRFCYLGDMLSAGGGCMAAATARCRCAWGKFRENLPLLTSKPVPFNLRGRLFCSNVRSSMLHGTETWPMTSDALHRLCRNVRAMIRWICGVKPSDDPSMDDLHAKLGICDLALLVRERRLRWFGHVMRSNGEINRVRSRPVPGRKGPGRPKKTWYECVKHNILEKAIMHNMYRQNLVSCFDASSTLVTESFVSNGGFIRAKIRSAMHRRDWSTWFVQILVLWLIYNADYYRVASIHFILGQYAKLLCQVITKLLILCTQKGTQNKWKKKYELHFLATEVLSLLDGDSSLPYFAQFTLKCGDGAIGTASPLSIFVCLYQQNLFWYHQDPYIPTGAKLYLQKPKCMQSVEYTRSRNSF